MDSALWFFEFISGWTATFILPMTMTSLPNIEKQMLTLVQIKSTDVEENVA